MDKKQGQKVELFISCIDLKNLDPSRNSHIFVIMLGYNGTQWLPLERTQHSNNDLNPNFFKSMTVEYHFEFQQYLRFDVYDSIDEQQSRLIGIVETTLAAIVGSKGQEIYLAISDYTSENNGTIIIRADYINDCPHQVSIHIKVLELNTIQSPNPFLKFYRLINDDPTPVLVYQTEAIKNSQYPEWKTIICQAQTLCNGDYQMPIKIELWNFQQKEQHILIGSTFVSLGQLQNSPADLKLNIIQGQGIRVGKLQIQFNLIVPIIDYIFAGLQLNLLVAIDFTASNKKISNITSLHYQDPNGTPTQYEQAIVSVGDILINYDYDKKVPVYGFGCKPKLNIINTNETLHCFPLNDNPDDPEVYQLQGIVQVYKDTVKRLSFDGPTYLHPVLQLAMQQAREIKEKKQDNYLILLILTDGQTDDLQITVDDVIASSHLPLSIVLIGIGNADFKNMEVLDNDDLSMVDSNGNKSQRDLVQFVPFNQYNGDTALLSREVLLELPDQIAQYMKLTNQHKKLIVELKKH